VSALASYWPLVFAAVVVVGLAVVIYIAVLLLRSAKTASFEDAEEAEAPPGGGEEQAAAAQPLRQSLGRSFRRAVARIRRVVPGPRPIYGLPWYALLGAEGSRPADLLARAGLDLPFGTPAEADPEGGSGCGFWFLERGIVVDLAGEYLLRRDGRTADDWGWRSFLRLLQRHRPQRPLDGLVLTLSARELHEVAAAGMTARVDLERRANLLYRKLATAQRVLGLRWPVYVLVTGCEALPGFAGFGGVVPPERRQDVFGWSNPYSIEAAYSGAWVDEAFAAMDDRLAQLQMEILAGRALGETADEVYQFPGGLAALCGPARVVLDQLFKPSGYHESFFFRGLYFCGAAASETLFLQGLFEHKVFRERNLGGPTRETLVSRNRRVLAAQVALAALALVLGAGTWWSYTSLARGKQTLKPFLEEVARDVAEHRKHQGVDRDEELQRAEVKQHMANLLEGMSGLSVERFRSVFLPGSWPWFTSFDDRLQAAAHQAQDQIVFKALYFALQDRAEALTAPSLGPPPRFIAWEPEAMGPLSAAPPEGIRVPAVEGTAEFVALARYVREVRALETHVELYEDLPQSRELTEFARLVQYLFGITLPKSFFEQADLYRNALAGVTHAPFAVEATRERAAPKAEGLAQALYGRLYRDNELVASLEELAAALEEASEGAFSPVAEPAELALLVEQIERVEQALGRPELEWARRPAFDLGPAFSRLLADMETSAFLGPQVARSVRGLGETGWWEFRRGLQDLGAPPLGPLLAVEDGQLALQLASEVLRLKAALASFLAQSFVRGEDGRSVATEVPPGTRLAWDLHLLDQAASLGETHAQFQAQTLPLFSDPWRGTVEEVAREALGRRIAHLVGRAQRFEPIPVGVSPLLRERELASAIGSFGAAVEPLNRLMDLAGRLRLPKLEGELADLLAGQGFSLLAAVDDLLAAGSPYAPRQGDFSWWDGTAPAALPAYGAADPAALAANHDLERPRIAQLATDYAKPLVTWLGKTVRARQPEFRGLFLRWEGILLSLQGYEAKKPGNPVALLEEFITQELATASPARCPGEATPAALVGTSSNYFLARRNELRRQLAGRCTGLTAERARSAYQALARYFDLRLAGRFPFAAAPPGPFASAADLADVREFFRLFDAGLATVAPARREPPAAAGAAAPAVAPACPEVCAPRDSAVPGAGADLAEFGAAGPAIAGFYRQMCAVRCFFAPYLDSPEPRPTLAVDLEVEFRVNRLEGREGEAGAAGDPASPEVELGGERILGWELAVGDQRVTHRDAEPRLTWRPGLPVRLTLRWAEDAPRLPARPFLAPDGRSVVYEYTDRWSLFSLLASHPSTDPRPHTLRLVVVTEPNPAAAAVPGEEPPTRVFVRLSLRAPAREGQPGPVLVVPRFPTAAPRLETATASR
jgi:type VI secretion system protein ImpL